MIYDPHVNLRATCQLSERRCSSRDAVKQSNAASEPDHAEHLSAYMLSARREAS